MVNFHTNAEMVVLLFLYIYCLYYIIRKIIIFIVFLNIFNLKKAADTDLVIVHWRQSKRGKSMHHGKISQTHNNINTLHLQINSLHSSMVVCIHPIVLF